MTLLEVRDLTVVFGRGRRAVRAVDGVSLAVPAGQTLGLVGESGSGKTTIARAITGLTSVTSGSVVFNGQDITSLSQRERRRLSSSLQLVFQDPYGSLNPARTIGDTLAEPLLTVRNGHRRQAVEAALAHVGLPAEALNRYPGAFSGGQRQRIAIARALVNGPRLVICDEPVSALDLSVQAGIINLLLDIQRELGLGYLLITHDLAVARHLSQRIAVIYRGQIVETGPAATVLEEPAHPYTRMLIAAMPSRDPTRRRTSSPPTASTTTSTVPAGTGCRFAARCPDVIAACLRHRPELAPSATGSLVACLRQSTS